MEPKGDLTVEAGDLIEAYKEQRNEAQDKCAMYEAAIMYIKKENLDLRRQLALSQKVETPPTKEPEAPSAEKTTAPRRGNRLPQTTKG